MPVMPNPVLIVVAALAVLVNSWLAVAAPQTHADPAGLVAMVLCADGAERTVYVDQQGNAAEGPARCQHCPDCLSAETVAVAAPVLPLRPVALSRMLDPTMTPATTTIGRVRDQAARAPPLKA